MAQRFGFEKLIMLMVLVLLALFALAVYAAGAYYAAHGTAQYMRLVQGLGATDALVFAAMVLAVGFLTSAMSVFKRTTLSRVGFAALSIAVAALMVYTTLEGKQAAIAQSTESKANQGSERALIISDIERLTKLLQQQTDVLSSANDAFTKAQRDLPIIAVCDKSSKLFTSCNAQRVKQTQANERLLNSLKPSESLRADIDKTNQQLASAKQALSSYDLSVTAKKNDEIGRLGFANLISSAIPEITSLLGSLFFSFFASQIAMILLKKQWIQVLPQFATDCDSNPLQHENSLLPPPKNIVKKRTFEEAKRDLLNAMRRNEADLSYRAIYSAYPEIPQKSVKPLLEDCYRNRLIDRYETSNGFRYVCKPPSPTTPLRLISGGVDG